MGDWNANTISSITFHAVGAGEVTAHARLESLLHNQLEQVSCISEWLSGGALKPFLSFDDGLVSHYTIAAPMLEEAGLRGAFFVYSAAFDDEPPLRELHAAFQSECYSSRSEFYKDYQTTLDELSVKLPYRLGEATAEITSHLSAFSFYSLTDRWYRYTRDCILSTDFHDQVLDAMMVAQGFDASAVLRNLWMTEDMVADLAARGHEIGLHSHSHLAHFGALPACDQLAELNLNSDRLEQIIGMKPRLVAWPLNSYSEHSLELAEAMGLQAGFRADQGKPKSRFDLPRLDQALLETFFNEGKPQ